LADEGDRNRRIPQQTFGTRGSDHDFIHVHRPGRVGDRRCLRYPDEPDEQQHWKKKDSHISELDAKLRRPDPAIIMELS
jgi:hypothetical protein